MRIAIAAALATAMIAPAAIAKPADSDRTWYYMDWTTGPDQTCAPWDMGGVFSEIRKEIADSHGGIVARVDFFAYGHTAVYRIVSNIPVNGITVRRMDVFTSDRAYCRANLETYRADAQHLIMGEPMVKGGDSDLGILDMTPITLGKP